MATSNPKAMDMPLPIFSTSTSGHGPLGSPWGFLIIGKIPVYDYGHFLMLCWSRSVPQDRSLYKAFGFWEGPGLGILAADSTNLNMMFVFDHINLRYFSFIWGHIQPLFAGHKLIL